MAVAVVAHANLAMAVYALAAGLNLPVSALDCLVLVPPVILVTTLPISIAGWGVRETAMVTAFGFAGIAPESALVLSLVFGVVVMVTALPGGLVFLLSGARLSAVEAEAGEPGDDPDCRPAGDSPETAARSIQ